jgi:hypothetical protein
MAADAAAPGAELQRAVERSLAMLGGQQFLSDFLFDPSVSSVAATLANQTAFDAAVTASYSDQFAEERGAGGSGLFDSATQFDILFAPAFSSGAFSLGVLVQRLTPTPSAPDAARRQHRHQPPAAMRCGSHPPSAGACVQPPLPSQGADYWGGCSPASFALGRYVRSDATGEMVLVLRPAAHAGGGARAQPPCAAAEGAAAPDGDSLRIFHYVHRGTRRRERTMLVCDAAGFSPARAAASVTMMQTTVESRFCPRCAAPPNGRCACTLADLIPGALAKHVFDYASHVDVMQSHVGAMLGQGVVVCTSASEGVRRRRLACPAAPVDVSPLVAARSTADRRLVRSPALISRIQICGYVKEDGSCTSPHLIQHDAVREILRSFAVKLSIAAVSPKEMVMPPAHAAPPMLALTSGRVDVGEFAVDQGGPVPMLTALDGDPELICGFLDDDGAGFPAAAACYSFGRGHDPSALFPPLLLRDGGETEADVTGTSGGSLGPGHAADAALDASFGVCGNGAAGVDGAGGDDVEDGNDAFRACERGVGLGGAPSGLMDAPAAWPCEGVAVDGDVVSASSGARPAASAAGGDVPADLCAPRQAARRGRRAKFLSEEERAAVELRRKTQNRAAASRSNARRKEKNDGLKSSILREKERVTALRVRQAELAAANEVLRLSLRQLGRIPTL